MKLIRKVVSRRIASLQNFNQSCSVETRLAIHSVVCVGTATRVARSLLNLGRPVTPFDLGVVLAAFVFEHARAELALRTINSILH